MAFLKALNLSPTGTGRAHAAGGGRLDARSRMDLLDDFEQAGLSWFWASDPAGNMVYLSDHAARSLGEASSWMGRPLTEVFEVDPDNPEARSDRPLKFMVSARNRISDLIVRVAVNSVDSRTCWWRISGQPKLDDQGNFLGYRGSAKDVTVEYERALVDSRLAEHDSLTGLFNRHYMTRRLDAMLAAFKDARRSVALMMIDLDRFKQVNDSMGHPAGDQLLQMVSERLASVVGTRGELGRLGGDEFQIILPDVDDRGKLGETADKIVKYCSQPYLIDGKHAVIGTSVGIAIAPYDGVERDELIRNADLALYSAKNGGRGQFRFYTDDLKDEAADRQQLVEELRLALDSDGLELHYQPVVRTSDGQVVGCEALLRWDHPERGALSPATFVPLAEEYSLIGRLGEWALRRACSQAAAWPADLRVAVNVSAAQFADPGFLDLVADVLQSSGLNADRLELELTESVFLSDTDTAEQLFADLKKMGVRLALDDFGTGFSSLSYLRTAPFDKLKVDRSFVSACTQNDRNSLKIIAAIIGLADALGMETTVEGVEAFDQLELVCERGARYVQGWIYAKSMPNADLLALMASGSLAIEPRGPDKYRPERRSMFRRVGLIHDDHRYEAILRDLSVNGARIEGLIGVGANEQMVLDLGKGQLVLGTVTRVGEGDFGMEFEAPLISDGSGGLCTRHRVSPYALAAAGMPLSALSGNAYGKLLRSAEVKSKPKFLEIAVAGVRAA